jgi:hypothetical protein
MPALTTATAFLTLPARRQTDNEYPKTTNTVIDAYLHVQHTHGPFTAVSGAATTASIE